jgi:hypothetical protein
MLAIRYVMLTALVVWLGGMVTLRLLLSPSGEMLRQFQLVEYACGAVILVCLLVRKFVGPPPRGFFLRGGLVGVMLAVAIYSGAVHQASAVPMTINMALGFVLLFWYVRE